MLLAKSALPQAKSQDTQEVLFQSQSAGKLAVPPSFACLPYSRQSLSHSFSQQLFIDHLYKL